MLQSSFLLGGKSDHLTTRSWCKIYIFQVVGEIHKNNSFPGFHESIGKYSINCKNCRQCISNNLNKAIFMIKMKPRCKSSLQDNSFLLTQAPVSAGQAVKFGILVQKWNKWMKTVLLRRADERVQRMALTQLNTGSLLKIKCYLFLLILI